MDAYKTNFQNGVRVRGVRYDDVLTDPEAVLGGILDHIGLAHYMDEIPNMLKAMGLDSHANSSNVTTAYLKSTKKHDPIPVASVMAAQIAKVDDFCTQLGLPLLSNSDPLEGTITKKV